MDTSDAQGTIEKGAKIIYMIQTQLQTCLLPPSPYSESFHTVEENAHSITSAHETASVPQQGGTINQAENAKGLDNESVLGKKGHREFLATNIPSSPILHSEESKASWPERNDSFHPPPSIQADEASVQMGSQLTTPTTVTHRVEAGERPHTTKPPTYTDANASVIDSPNMTSNEITAVTSYYGTSVHSAPSSPDAHADDERIEATSYPKSKTPYAATDINSEVDPQRDDVMSGQWTNPKTNSISGVDEVADARQTSPLDVKETQTTIVRGDDGTRTPTGTTTTGNHGCEQDTDGNTDYVQREMELPLTGKVRPYCILSIAWNN